jgi:hypothetical protein
MGFVLVVGLIGGLFALVAWGVRAARRQALASLTALAERTGLELVGDRSSWDSNSLRVEGVRQGKRVRFWAYATGSGKSRRNWIAVGVAPRRSGRLEFRLEAQGFGTKVAEFFGAKEIRVGDPAFDAAWFIRTNAPEAFAAALLPEIRVQLTAARAAGATQSFKLEDGWVSYAELGQFSDAKRLAQLESLLPLLLDLADAAEVCADA